MSTFPKAEVVGILLLDGDVQTRWSVLYEALLTDVSLKLKLERVIKNDTGQFYDVFSDMLSAWTSRIGSDATVESFITILRDKQFTASAQNIAKAYKLESVLGATNPALQPVPVPAIVIQSSTKLPVKPLPISKVAPILAKDLYLIQNWVALFNLLDLEDAALFASLDHEFNKARSMTALELFQKLLTTWTGQKGKTETTRSVLIEILRKNKFTTAAEDLEEKLPEDC